MFRGRFKVLGTIGKIGVGIKYKNKSILIPQKVIKMKNEKYYRLFKLIDEIVDIINTDSEDNFDATAILDTLITGLFSKLTIVNKEEKLKLLISEAERILESRGSIEEMREERQGKRLEGDPKYWEK